MAGLGHGDVTASAARERLSVGPLEATLDGTALRWIRVGSLEVLRSIEFTLRDQAWGTVTPTVSDSRVTTTETGIVVEVHAHLRRHDIDFDAALRFRIDQSGTVDVELAGRANRTFLRNRLGFIVLHPMAVAGAAVDVEHRDGSDTAATFPSEIAPWPLFSDVAAMRWRAAPDLTATLSLDGESFEVEDQRNWGDASYKTYGPSLNVPFPVEVREGSRIRQSVRLQVQVDGPRRRRPTDRRERVVVSDRQSGHLPPIGLATRAGQPMPSDEAVTRLRVLGPAHLRIVLELDSRSWSSDLHLATMIAKRLGTVVEIEAVAANEGELDQLAHTIAEGRLPVKAVAVFARSATDSRADLVAHAVHLLRPARIQVGAGTRANFTELNRLVDRDSVLAGADRVCYTVNPQVHAFDEASIVETLPALRAQRLGAADMASGRPLDVVLTLKPRFNAADGVVALPVDPSALPDDVDLRQAGDFVAAWTVGALAALCADDVASLTVFETTGMRGVMADSETDALHPLFPAAPGAVFPVFDVLRQVLAMRHAAILEVEAPDDVAVLALDDPVTGVRVVLANLSEQPRSIALVSAHGPLLDVALEPWQVVVIPSASDAHGE